MKAKAALKRRILETEALLHSRGAILAIGRGDTSQPGIENSRICLQPSLGGCLAVLALADRIHDGAFHLQFELQIGQQLADIGAIRGIAGTGQGVDFRAAEAISEPVSSSAPARAPNVVTTLPARAVPVTLADELAELNRAETALGAGDTRTAFEALDHYDRVLKGRRMRAEATLLRIETLSRAGQPKAAAALAARFVKENPGSPLVDRAESFMSRASAPDAGVGPR